MFHLPKTQDKVRETKRSLITLVNPQSPIAEQYRTIRTNLQFTSLGADLQTIVVTSASPGEGKSTTASNLAIVYAQLGKRVLLVDCDMRKPTAHFTFQLPGQLGLSTVLAKRTTLERSIQATQVPKLSMLPAGPIPPNPSELLASPMMKRVLEEIKQSYDMIILDAPPIMQVADSRIVASEADGTILVIGCDNSNRDYVLKAKEQLELSGANILGLVMNKRDKGKERHYHYKYD
ncbi:CpsD/CapB family tyrosine-protein kinase [Exiguobacterium sp. CH10]|uniref:CpsD/CapB family tyrosine-protein kinase n=1 Tax=Exiguobacterium sp. CH10 TaxID=2751261 RepID=UPI001BE77105|nr:CpsD/CapB family tyrosine-protein kinase [Exiguobacterium sp. CH10]